MDRSILHRSSNLFYRAEGGAPANHPEGPTLVLLHGFAEDGSVWDELVNDLRQKHPKSLVRILIPDLPGSGRSSPLAGETSMEELAESIAAILDAEKIAQAVLIGHSMGGYITLAFAEKYPDRLKAFGLFHSTAYPDSEEKKAARKKSIEFIRKNGSHPFIRQSSPHLFSEHFRLEYPEIVEAFISHTDNFNPDSLVYYSQAMIERPDRTTVLEKSTHPVLFVIGGRDTVLPTESILRQTHMPGLSYIHILQQAGHMGMLEDTGKAARVLDEFLQQIR